MRSKQLTITEAQQLAIVCKLRDARTKVEEAQQALMYEGYIGCLVDVLNTRIDELNKAIALVRTYKP